MRVGETMSVFGAVPPFRPAARILPMGRPGATLFRGSRLGAALPVLSMLLLAACAGNRQSPAPVITPTASGQAGGGQAGAGNVIFVSRGEGIEDVARRYNVPLADLVAVNHLSVPYTLTPGQRLVLPSPHEYTVRAGDTLYGVARTLNVPSGDLIRLNGLTPPYMLRTGQVLQLPGGGEGVPPSAGTTAGAGVGVGGDVAASSRTGVPAAAQHRTVEVQELGPPGTGGGARPASPGGVTAVPLPPAQGTGGAVSPAGPPPSSPVGSNPAGGRTTAMAIPLPPVSQAPPAGAQPTYQAPSSAPAPSPAPAPSSDYTPPEPSPPPPAATETPASAATSNPALAPRDGGRFQWPVHGTVLSSYGPKEGGLHNDGINIGAPAGTPVVAAEDGVVAYAGNELRGFGNLVLIRHADGWVTAYAHLERAQVEKGAKVSRGQRIGSVGATGNVTSPQLHFEVRRGSKVVDPMGFLNAAH